MMARALLLLALATICATLPAHADDASGCADRTLVVERLAAGYGEARQALGLTATGSVVEVFASAKSGTWTILLTLPSGVTCPIVSGEAYTRIGAATVAVVDGEPM